MRFPVTLERNSSDEIVVPFTVSHAAAVLPLQRLGKHRLPLTALMVGSMAPDFGYFFSSEASRALTHSFSGLFIFSLPAGLAVWLFYVAVLEKATITLLSDRWHTRFAHTDAITPSLIARACPRHRPRRHHPPFLGCLHASRDLRDERVSRVARADARLRLVADLPPVARTELGRRYRDPRDLGARSAPPAREVAHPALQDQRTGADRRAVVPGERLRCSPD